MFVLIFSIAIVASTYEGTEKTCAIIMTGNSTGSFPIPPGYSMTDILTIKGTVKKPPKSAFMLDFQSDLSKTPHLKMVIYNQGTLKVRNSNSEYLLTLTKVFTLPGEQVLIHMSCVEETESCNVSTQTNHVTTELQYQEMDITPLINTTALRVYENKILLISEITICKKSPPLIVVSINPSLSSLTTQYNLSCTIRGPPVLQGSWFKDNKKLDSQKTLISESFLNISLHVNSSEGGDYLCKGWSVLGGHVAESEVFQVNFTAANSSVSSDEETSQGNETIPENGGTNDDGVSNGTMIDPPYSKNNDSSSESGNVNTTGKAASADVGTYDEDCAIIMTGNSTGSFPIPPGYSMTDILTIKGTVKKPPKSAFMLDFQSDPSKTPHLKMVIYNQGTLKVRNSNSEYLLTLTKVFTLPGEQVLIHMSCVEETESCNVSTQTNYVTTELQYQEMDITPLINTTALRVYENKILLISEITICKKSPPLIVVSINPSLFSHTTQYNLTCTIRGPPVLQGSWFKDNEKLDSQKTLVSESFLNISLHVNTSEGGDYLCKGWSVLGGHVAESEVFQVNFTAANSSVSSDEETSQGNETIPENGGTKDDGVSNGTMIDPPYSKNNDSSSESGNVNTTGKAASADVGTYDEDCAIIMTGNSTGSFPIPPGYSMTDILTIKGTVKKPPKSAFMLDFQSDPSKTPHLKMVIYNQGTLKVRNRNSEYLLTLTKVFTLPGEQVLIHMSCVEETESCNVSTQTNYVTTELQYQEMDITPLINTTAMRVYENTILLISEITICKKSPPLIMVSINPPLFSHTTQYNLTCTIRGPPLLQGSWFKDNEKLDSQKTLVSESFVKISLHVNTSEGGDYLCKGWSVLGGHAAESEVFQVNFTAANSSVSSDEETSQGNETIPDNGGTKDDGVSNGTMIDPPYSKNNDSSSESGNGNTTGKAASADVGNYDEDCAIIMTRNSTGSFPIPPGYSMTDILTIKGTVTKVPQSAYVLDFQSDPSKTPLLRIVIYNQGTLKVRKSNNNYLLTLTKLKVFTSPGEQVLILMSCVEETESCNVFTQTNHATTKLQYQEMDITPLINTTAMRVYKNTILLISEITICKKSPPLIVVSINPPLFSHTTLYNLTCTIRGPPVLQGSWFKDNEKLDSQETLVPESFVKISLHVNSSEGGGYVCKGWSVLGGHVAESEVFQVNFTAANSSVSSDEESSQGNETIPENGGTKDDGVSNGTMIDPPYSKNNDSSSGSGNVNTTGKSASADVGTYDEDCAIIMTGNSTGSFPIPPGYSMTDMLRIKGTVTQVLTSSIVLAFKSDLSTTPHIKIGLYNQGTLKVRYSNNDYLLTLTKVFTSSGEQVLIQMSCVEETESCNVSTQTNYVTTELQYHEMDITPLDTIALQVDWNPILIISEITICRKSPNNGADEEITDKSNDTSSYDNKTREVYNSNDTKIEGFGVLKGLGGLQPEVKAAEERSIVTYVSVGVVITVIVACTVLSAFYVVRARRRASETRALKRTAFRNSLTISGPIIHYNHCRPVPEMKYSATIKVKKEEVNLEGKVEARLDRNTEANLEQNNGEDIEPVYTTVNKAPIQLPKPAKLDRQSFKTNTRVALAFNNAEKCAYEDECPYAELQFIGKKRERESKEMETGTVDVGGEPNYVTITELRDNVGEEFDKSVV